MWKQKICKLFKGNLSEKGGVVFFYGKEEEMGDIVKKQKDTLIKNKLTQSIRSLSLDKEELKRLCNILQERSDAAATIEVEKFKRADGLTDEAFEKEKKLLREAFELKITITGTNGTELYGNIDEVFNSPNFSGKIRTFYVNSETTLKAAYNWYPRNSFDLCLDFSKPKVFDLSLMPSQYTPNNSNLRVQGFEATWANGVFHEINNYINERTAVLSWVHNHSIYDMLLWVLGLPLAFWACYKFSQVVGKPFVDLNIFAQNAVYVYIFFIMLFVFRILFHYLRWIVPLVEFRDDKNRAVIHRWIFGTLLIGVLGCFVYDVLKWIF